MNRTNNHALPTQRQDAWEMVRGDIFDDLARKGGGGLDLVDIRGYDMALVPLEQLICTGRLGPDAQAVWKIRIGIRDCEFRPTYSQVGRIVADVLSLTTLPRENSDAYRVAIRPEPTEMMSHEPSVARDHARGLIKALNERESQKPYTVEDALAWRPSSLPGSPNDPAEEIPADDREDWIRRAYYDLCHRGKGRRGLATRLNAVKLWRQAQGKAAECDAAPFRIADMADEDSSLDDGDCGDPFA